VVQDNLRLVDIIKEAKRLDFVVQTEGRDLVSFGAPLMLKCRYPLLLSGA